MPCLTHFYICVSQKISYFCTRKHVQEINAPDVGHLHLPQGEWVLKFGVFLQEDVFLAFKMNVQTIMHLVIKFQKHFKKERKQV